MTPSTSVRSACRRALALAGLIALAAAAPACRTPTQAFIWVDAVPKSMSVADPTYRIAPGDVISVRVFGQDANSVERVRVRDDGMISLPLLNDVEVAGMEPTVLSRRLEVKLKQFITSPLVTVVVNERRPLRVSVVGKVTRPGVYDLDQGAGVLHALAAAGGLNPFAHDDGVFVLRNGYWVDDPAPARIRFRYAQLAAGRPPASTFLLRAGDVIVVE